MQHKHKSRRARRKASPPLFFRKKTPLRRPPRRPPSQMCETGLLLRIPRRAGPAAQKSPPAFPGAAAAHLPGMGSGGAGNPRSETFSARSAGGPPRLCGPKARMPRKAGLIVAETRAQRPGRAEHSATRASFPRPRPALRPGCARVPPQPRPRSARQGGRQGRAAPPCPWIHHPSWQ